MDGSLRNRLNNLWWYWLPLKANLFSQTLSASLADGIYLTAWSTISAFAPLLVSSVGFLIGWHHFGFVPGVTFTFSIPVMAFLLAISSFSAGLGAWVWLGYVLGDFWFFPHRKYDEWFNTFAYIQIPPLISYALLATLLVSVPLLCTSIRQQTTPYGERFSTLRMAAGAALQALLQTAFVYIWMQSIPILIRPLYTWQGQSPVVEAIQPLQLQGHNLIVIAAILGGVRVLIEAFAMLKPGVMQSAIHLQEALRVSYPYLSLPPWIGLPIRAAFTTIILSGMLKTQEEAIVLGTILTLIFFLREGLLIPLGLWRGWISRVPLLLRLIVAILLNYYLSAKIVEFLWNKNPDDSFLPIAIAVVVGILVFSLLIPPPKIERSKGAVAPKEV